MLVPEWVWEDVATLDSRGCFSIFADGDISILVGDMDIQTVVSSAGVSSAVITNSARRVIPVTEIEVGGSIHMRNITASAGYFLAAWHDLGMRENMSLRIQVVHRGSKLVTTMTRISWVLMASSPG